ncbi:MAG: CHASE2 domain-containing protein [Leptospiraceae bacterium]|nr:CHASE2 domain-containing protein [Leptospiraceae bacterium]MDW7975421.1 adenylate/guanylate cyclase domain-containing protein [Leptospiraceae bacterium]
MKRIAKYLFITSLSILILMPIFLFILIEIKSSYLINYVHFFQDVYFTIGLGLLFLGVVFYFEPKILKRTKEKKWNLNELFSLIVFGISVLFFFYLYFLEPDSWVHQIKAIFPLIDFVSPDLFTFLLWWNFFLILISAWFLYRIVSEKKQFKEIIGSILLSLVIGFLFGILLLKVPFLHYLEETFHSLKYNWLRNPGRSIHLESGLPYCQAPYDATGKKLTVFAPNPPLVREDIEILGITNVTLEKLQGNWPIDWGIYAEVINKLNKAENNILLFDISFLDNKGIYGGSHCGVLFECRPLNKNQILKSQVDILSEALQKNKNIILADYPIETTDESRPKIVNYEKRLAILNEKERLTNIKNGEYAIVWGKLPVPPIEKIAIYLDGMGYANILKPETGINRQVPLVARIVNSERATSPDYDPNKDDYFYPGIDLIAVAKYYGIDIKKDIEVDFLEGYVKLKNIPEKTFTKFDFKTLKEITYDIMAKPNPQREIIIPIDLAGRMNINFRGGRYCFKSREILEVTELSQDDASAYYSNKITLIAMYYATGVGTAQDIHLSPYGDMAGIEHHAYAINTILNQDFAYTVPDSINFLILLIVSLIMGTYHPFVKTTYNYILFVIIALAYSFITFFITFNQFSLLHIYPTVIILQFTQLIAFVGFRVLTEEENVKFIRTTFSKFVSQDVVEELLNNPDAITLGGSKREITVFFSDVRGFTTVSERLTPEDLVNLINEYLSEMTELIIDYRGTIDKYMGDAIMAFWGAPTPNDDHAYYACVAALAQAKKLKELQQRWKERNIPVLDIGIGINTGPAVVGNMGSSRRMDYTVMGDTVNLGSRLEGTTKTYGVQICISEFTYERVKDRVYARELDLVRVKGKLEPVRIYELMGLVNEEDFEKLKISTKKT